MSQTIPIIVLIKCIYVCKYQHIPRPIITKIGLYIDEDFELSMLREYDDLSWNHKTLIRKFLGIPTRGFIPTNITKFVLYPHNNNVEGDVIVDSQIIDLTIINGCYKSYFPRSLKRLRLFNATVDECLLYESRFNGYISLVGDCGLLSNIDYNSEYYVRITDSFLKFGKF